MTCSPMFHIGGEPWDILPKAYISSRSFAHLAIYTFPPNNIRYPEVDTGESGLPLSLVLLTFIRLQNSYSSSVTYQWLLPTWRPPWRQRACNVINHLHQHDLAMWCYRMWIHEMPWTSKVEYFHTLGSESQPKHWGHIDFCWPTVCDSNSQLF